MLSSRKPATLGLHVIQFPSKRWGFAGSVPMTLAYLGDPAEIEKARRFGPGFAKVKPVAFDTREEAIAYAASLGYEVSND